MTSASFREAEQRRLSRLSHSRAVARYRARTRVLGLVFVLATVVLTVIMLVVR